MSVMNAYSYPTIELEVDGIKVTVAYATTLYGVRVMSVKPVEPVSQDDMDWVSGQLDMVETLVAKELESPAEDTDDIGD